MKKIILLILVLLFSANICFAADFGGIYTGISNAGKAAALLAIIWGGIRYVLSIGDPHLMGEAQTWVIAGFTGLALILCADAIIPLITGGGISWTISGNIPRVPVTPLVLSGVHLYTKGGCPEIAPDIPDRKYLYGMYYQSSQRSLSKKVKSVKIINDAANGYVWEVIAFSGIDFKGRIKEVLSAGCIDVNAQSLAILNIATSPTEAGEEVRFYEDKSGHGGAYVMKNTEITGGFQDLATMEIIYEKTDRSPERQEECKHLYEPPGFWSWSRCLQSIEIDGSYAVLLKEEGGDEYIEHQLWLGPDGPDELESSPWNYRRPKEVKIIPFTTK